MAGDRGEPMVCVAQVATAHGVRGALKLRCFTQAPESVAAYGPLCDEAGHELFAVRVVSVAKGGVIVAAEGIADLYVPRSRLPATDQDEFYHEDLVGLAARDAQGRSVGRVLAVHDFGAGDILEIATEDGRSEMVPFTRDAVPEVDLAAGVLTVVLPEGEAVGEPEEARA
jgi:16S rRNA processing protein RimM